MRILLTGKNGQLGWELHRQLERDYEVVAIGREDIDFLDSRFLFRTLKQLPKLDLIVNTAAYTNVDQAEAEPFVAESINSESVALLAAEADRRGIPIIHFSTDYVFDGKNWTRPYREMDKPNPLSTYAWTKLEGEIRVRNITEKHLIFRLAGLYGIRRKNFFTTMLRHHHNGITPRVVNDQVVSPNWTPLIAEAVTHVIEMFFQGETTSWGTYHLSGGGSTTWHEFAQYLFQKANEKCDAHVPPPIAVASKEYGAIAKRPDYSVLDSTKFNTNFHYSLPDWQEQFLRFLGEIQPQFLEKSLCSTF